MGLVGFNASLENGQEANKTSIFSTTNSIMAICYICSTNPNANSRSLNVRMPYRLPPEPFSGKLCPKPMEPLTLVFLFDLPQV